MFTSAQCDDDWKMLYFLKTFSRPQTPKLDPTPKSWVAFFFFTEAIIFLFADPSDQCLIYILNDDRDV